MPNKDTTPLSLYGNDREYLREQEKTNELLADIAGEEYESPGDIPNGKYVIQKRLLDAAQKKNELLESIAEGSGTGGGGAAKAIGIDYATDIISLKNRDGDVISGSGATLPAYGVSFDPTTGGLTLTKNGTAVQGQTVTIPNYGSPVGVTDSADMVDEGTIYLYEGTTGGGFTNGHFYYYNGSAWADGGEYAAATVQTDKTLLVEDRAADAKATGEAVGELKTQIDKTFYYTDELKYVTFTDGYYIKTNVAAGVEVDLTPVQNNGLAYAIFDIEAGQKVIINGNGWSTGRLWCFVDKDNKRITNSNSLVEATDLTVIAPANAKKCILNCYKNSVGLCVYGNIQHAKDEVAIIREVLGFDKIIKGTDIDLTVGEAHSWETKATLVTIPKDTVFSIVLKTRPTGILKTITIRVGYSDDTTEAIVSGLADQIPYTRLKASKDIVKLGVYASASNVIDTGTCTPFIMIGEQSNQHYYDLYQSDLCKSPLSATLGSYLNDYADKDYGVNTAYSAAMHNAIMACMAEWAGDTMKVPFVLTTDQHAVITSKKKGIFDLLNNYENWNNISAVFNLGDTIGQNWTDNAETQSLFNNPFLKSEPLELYLFATKSIPDAKRIELWGNHDVWYKADDSDTTTILPDYKYNNPYFFTGSPRTIRHPDNSNLMVIYDDYYKIKYIAISDFDFVVDYLDYHVTADHWQWIVEQLSKNDGYDIVLISHHPLDFYNTGAYDPTTNEAITGANRFVNDSNFTDINAIWNARKNKQSGSFTVDGVAINYDFTNCTDNLLLCMSGHVHKDVVDYVEGTGLLEVAYDYYLYDTIHFGIIDRRNRKIKVWKLSNDNDTPAVVYWEAPFDKV